MTWQPIETAPKDGSLVRVRAAEKRWYYLARWTERYSYLQGCELTGWWSSGGAPQPTGVYDGASPGLILDPAEWAPLE